MKPKPPTGPQPITNLAELEKLVSPLEVQFSLGDKQYVVTGRRLKPAENLQVRLLLHQALPPELPAQKDPDGKPLPPQYDFRNPDYLKRKEEHERTARAIALCAAYPDIFKAPAEAKDTKDLARYVENVGVDDATLSYLFERCMSSAFSVEGAANFS